MNTLHFTASALLTRPLIFVTITDVISVQKPSTAFTILSTNCPFLPRQQSRTTMHLHMQNKVGWSVSPTRITVYNSWLLAKNHTRRVVIPLCYHAADDITETTDYLSRDDGHQLVLILSLIPTCHDEFDGKAGSKEIICYSTYFSPPPTDTNNITPINISQIWIVLLLR